MYCIVTSGYDNFASYSWYIYPQNSYLQPLCVQIWHQNTTDVASLDGHTMINNSPFLYLYP